MAKDQFKNQASWEKKKEKLDKKKDKERVADRKSEKVGRQVHKRVLEVKAKEAANRKAFSTINALRAVAAIAVIVYYAVAVGANDNKNSLMSDPTVSFAVLVVVLSAICFGGSSWQAKFEAAQEKQEQAEGIKDSLEQKEAEQEKEKLRAERRAAQLIQLKDQAKRRMEEEKKYLEQTKELARALRERRLKRETEEAVQAKKENAGDGVADVHGWTAAQYDQLREAVKKYPEGWSYAKGKRWSMIASEVDGKDARTCESTWARLEEEARAATSDAKAAAKAAKAQNAAASSSVQDDFDWLGDEDTTDFGAVDEDSDDDVEEEEDEATNQRMAIEVEPEHKGTEIRLDGIKAMRGCSTVQIEVLHIQLSCADCRTTTRVYLSGSDEDCCDAKQWCEGCSGLMSVRLRPTLLHQASSRLCYVDCVRCNVTDMLPSVLMSVCDNCDAYNIHKQEFQRNKVIDGTCFACHSKYGFGAESIRIEQVTPCDPGPGNRSGNKSSKGSDDPMDEIAEELRYLRKKAKSDPRQALIQLGRPLPQNGACKHFKKSYKWYRFACCGRAFPCPQCHIESDCPAAALGAHATRQICGKCCMEQAYSPSNPCEKCGFSMMAKGSAHWDDGGGTRNLTVMSTKDNKKFKGGVKQVTSKFKTSSSKADRVGAKAKKAREHQKVFGKD